MQVRTSNKPAEALAEHMRNCINQHPGTTLCFLAGGSALEIIPYLRISAKDKVRTIFCLGDERGSREANLNNYLQLIASLAPDQTDWQIIASLPNSAESINEFADRMTKKISAEISRSTDLQIIVVLGIGQDGHTAGIFPLPKADFATMYPHDLTYVPVHLDSLTIDSRASLTPDWILEKADLLLGYAVGASKLKMLNKLTNENFEIFDMPAQLIKRHRQSFLYTDQSLQP